MLHSTERVQPDPPVHARVHALAVFRAPERSPEVAAVYEALGWDHWARNAAERLEKDYPQTRNPL